MWIPAIRADFDSCEMTLEKLPQQLVNAAKTAINSVYGLTAYEQKIQHEGDPQSPAEYRKLCNKIQKEKNKAIYDNMIQRVIFNPPATIVFWRDGSKTVVKCGENDIFDPEKGLAMAISKRAFGDNRDYYEIFAKWVGKYEYQQKRKEKKS